MLVGCRRLRHKKYVRLPITSSVLQKIFQQLPYVTYSRYERTLFRAIYSLAYFGLLWVNELVVNTFSQVRHALFAKDLLFEPSSTALTICIRSSKTQKWGGGAPVWIRIMIRLTTYLVFSL